MKIDLKKFEKLVKDNYISKNKHDSLGLLIWNYTNKTSIDDYWTDETLMARGLITDLNGNIIARPLKKFFNLNQRPEDSISNLPTDIPTIYEKLDGSMLVQFYDGTKVCVATRGSFNSDQAIHGTKLLKKFSRNDFDQKYTYVWELITKWNRIVVDYGDRDECVLLAIINTETGEEGDYILEAKRLGVSYARVYNGNISELIEVVKTLPPNEEGFVIKYKNNYRVKLKGVEYLRLHKLMTGFSTKSIWECLMNGDSFENILTDVPDEFFAWITEKKKELENKYSEIKVKAEFAYSVAQTFPDRKSQAIFLQNEYKDVMSEVFARLNGKDMSKIIWKKLKPIYELPFFKENTSDC